MSEIKIRRRSRSLAVTLSTSTANATTLRLEDFAGGAIDIGTTVTAVTTLRIFAASTEVGPYRRLHDDTGDPADVVLSPSTIEGRVYPLPDALFAVQFAKLLVNSTAGEGVQATVTIKS
jgi:hypothetical protein